ncbi:uncharacterized protein BDR25DRAFT_275926 [Lindgomyces ingoldianus]|uniref:Uncharacterized protein n=1 Tax=Lindgomyces ingoldianus TaxID=673940 RepID=A0ACB6RI45_9PLEO|nr:uncharacterized protein BDR25DRAFT_275926 [Lindgomyces ingoldianus]KAF2478146.1 hypothetical protein BDR25DRAFT_275926 [Lindgomyces ingoldianus]
MPPLPLPLPFPTSIPQRPLASLICPSAPFLAPRLLCVPRRSSPCLRLPTLHLRLGAAYATNIRKESAKARYIWNRNAGNSHLKGKALASFRERFVSALDARNLPVVVELYPALVESIPLEPRDTRAIATQLHNYLRNHPNPASQSEFVLMFLERITQDIQSRKLPPHTFAHVHLLGIYKECKKYDEGYAFWLWLQEQDDTYVDQAVYGAAIEMLAFQGRTSLATLEELYINGLKRFPGTFAEYHLSPEAIVPDRTQPTTIPGIPLILLQGILTARMCWRDWKKAYLALDTALRLYPHQVPPRFFELFMNERPMSEGYTVFLLACRAGILLKPNHLTSLLSMLSDTMGRCPSLDDRMVILQGMVNALYAYLEAGGMIQGPHVGSILNAFGNLLPRKPFGEDYQGNEGKIRNIIVTTAHEIMKTLIQSGVPPQPQLFISLIKLAGTLRVPSLLEVSLRDIETARIDIGAIGSRNVLISAGHLRDRATLERFWTAIASQAESEGRQVTYSDWITFGRACRQADLKDFFNEQLQKFKHSVTPREEVLLAQELNWSEKPPTAENFSLMDPANFISMMGTIRARINDIATAVMSGQTLDLLKTPFPMFLDPERRSLGLMKDLRAVYDELSTDPYQPPQKHTPQHSIPLSATGIPLDELRFQNWVTVMELMSEAEATELEFQRRLDEAIAKGRPFKQNHHILTFRFAASAPPSRDEVRATIRRLRASRDPLSSPAPPTNIRKVVTEIHTPSSSGAKSSSSHLYKTIFQSGSEFSTKNTSAAKSSITAEYTTSSPSNEDVSYAEARFTPLIRPVISVKPQIKPYISLESTHKAPAPSPTSLKHRPLAKPKRSLPRHLPASNSS